MGTIVVVLLLALVLSAGVMTYAAYPYRGHDTPLTPRLGEAMRRGVDYLPTLDRETMERETLDRETTKREQQDREQQNRPTGRRVAVVASSAESHR